MIEIQPADIVADAGLLVESLRTHLTARSDMQRHAWLYRQNPHGQALAWIARDTTKQLVVGSGAIIPRRMWYQGAPQMACVMARMWASLKVPSKGLPRWPLVPKETAWAGFAGSGWSAE